MEDQITILMVPFPSQGHLNPLLHLSHLMISSYNIPIHFISTHTHTHTHTHQPKIHIHGYGSINKIHFHDFQLPSLPLLEASTHLRQPIYNLLIKLANKNFRRIIVVHDLIMSYVVQDFKLLSNVETYVFNPISAFTYFLGVWENIPKEMKPFELDLNDILECSIPSSEGCVTPDVLEFTMNQYKYLGFESGWVYNTSRILEGRYVHFLEMLSSRRLGVKHFAFGPFSPVDFKGQLLLDHSAENKHGCLKWLDEQEKDSVIYIAFGSTTSLKDDQIQELANGLERSKEKFLWVIHEVEENPKTKRFHDLEKFEERVKGRGIIVRDWAPQLEILAHSSTGGFLSHCGWNSCIESLSMGVPIVAWPIQYDQPRNATLICGVLKVGMMVRDWEHHDFHEQLVMSNTIENVVKMLMKSKEGNEMRQRCVMLGEILRGSIGQGGVSSLEREAFFAHINR